MRRSDLATKLVSASSNAARRCLINSNKRLADAALARKIKDICYAAWTTEPAVARKAADALRILSDVTAEPEIAALFYWIAGIADITRGRFPSAIRNLDLAAEKFRRRGNQLDSANTQVAKLIALGLLGRYIQADKSGRDALAVFLREGDELAAGKVEMNLSNLAFRRESYSEAEKFYLSALRRFKKLGERSWQTMAENNLANTYAEINDFRRAEKYYSMAADSARRAKMRVTEAEIEASMGNLELFRGRYADALRLLEMSRQKYDVLNMPHQTAIAELEMADIYAELRLLDEAYEMLDALVRRFRNLGLKKEEARACVRLGQVAAQLHRPIVARRALQRAEVLYVSENNHVGIARVKLELAKVRLAEVNYKAAEEQTKAAIKILKDTSNKRLLVLALWLKGEIARQSGKFATAKKELSVAKREAAQGKLPSLEIVALDSLGKVFSQTGDLKSAKALFKRSIAITESIFLPIASDEFRRSFLAGRLEPYTELLKLALAEGRITEAFRYAEASRARSLAESMQAVDAGSSHDKLQSKLLKLREELNWFYSRLNRGADDEARKIEKEIGPREKVVVKLSRQMESVTTKSKVINLKLDLQKLQKRLKNDMALIEYVVIDGSISAFVVTGRKVEFVRDIAAVSEITPLLEALRFQFGTFRFGVHAVEKFAEQLKRTADSYLQKLYGKLLKPLDPLVEDRGLLIVPAGVLNYVPFPALNDGNGYTIERREITHVPSAGVWQALDEKPDRALRNALLIGFADESIPLAEDEVAALAKRFPRSITYKGRDATFESYFENASKADVIHLACHGQFRHDNPMFSSLHLANGWVTVNDIYRRKLRARLVTLSACETGLSKIQPGEEILGLTRGFLSAGAKSLIVTLWTVNDEVTFRLMDHFYRSLQLGRTVAASLTLAQRDLIRQGVHPYFWAPFIAIGR